MKGNISNIYKENWFFKVEIIIFVEHVKYLSEMYSIAYKYGWIWVIVIFHTEYLSTKVVQDRCLDFCTVSEFSWYFMEEYGNKCVICSFKSWKCGWFLWSLITSILSKNEIIKEGFLILFSMKNRIDSFLPRSTEHLNCSNYK